MPRFIIIPTLQQFMNKMIAVHVTDSLPINGKQTAGSCTQQLNDETFKLKRTFPLRHTIHWSLGAMAIDHEGSSKVAFGGVADTYSKRKYALVTRFGNLAPQILNIFAYDVVTVGDYNLDSKDWLVAPHGTIIENRSEFNIFNYDPTNSTLEQAIQEVIVKIDGWKVRFTGDGALHDKAYINLDGSEVEINNPVFLKSIIESFNVSFGTHQLSMLGWQSSYISALECINSYLMLTFLEFDPESTQPTNDKEVAIAKIISQHALSDLREYFQKLTRLPANTKTSLLAFLDELQCWHNLLDVEELLNQKKRTLIGAGIILRDQLLGRLSHKDAMIAFAIENLNSFPMHKQQHGEQVNVNDLMPCLANIPWIAVKQQIVLDDKYLSKYLVFRLLTKGGHAFIGEGLDTPLTEYCVRLLANKTFTLEPFVMNALKELSELAPESQAKKELQKFIADQSINIKVFGELLAHYNKPEIRNQMPPAFANELAAINAMRPQQTQVSFMGWLSSKVGLPIGQQIIGDPPAYANTKSSNMNPGKCNCRSPQTDTEPKQYLW